jgi:hypothetical protein
MTTSDHRHSNNAHHSNNNNQTKDVEIDSGIIFYLKFFFYFLFL